MKIEDALEKIDNSEVRDCIMKHLYFDPMTGLPNQQLLEIRLQEYIHRSTRVKKPFTYAIFDIAGTKYVNDTYGKSKGNELIKNAADLLSLNKRTYDFLARDGTAADEFILLIDNMTEKNHEDFLNRLIQKKYDYGVEGVPIVLYSGFSQFTGQSLDQLRFQAEKELNKNKIKVKKEYPWLCRT